MNESLVLNIWAELKRLESAITTIQQLEPPDNSIRPFVGTLHSLLEAIEWHPTYESIRKEVEKIDARRYAERNRQAAQRRVQQKSQAAPHVA